MSKTTPTNSDDVIDSRDIIARIAELKDLIQDEEADDDDKAELKILQDLAEEAEGYAADWKYGETLIRDSYFEDYTRELASDIGAIDKDANWPNDCIDWEKAASELQQDYKSVDFDSVTYWIR